VLVFLVITVSPPSTLPSPTTGGGKERWKYPENGKPSEASGEHGVQREGERGEKSGDRRKRGKQCQGGLANMRKRVTRRKEASRGGVQRAGKKEWTARGGL